MDSLNIKYYAYAKHLPPQPIRLANVNWAGPPVKMKDGSDPQPWHCLPFVEGSTYGLELIYPYETECHVVQANGTIHFEYDYTKEPGGVLLGAEFLAFSPVNAAKYYLFATRLDLQCPPGYTLRTEPHPRYFTDDTGTVPLPMIGHLQNDWYPRKVFVVFRAPWRPGERHIFRKGEPFVQLLFVPQRLNYEITQMTPEEAQQRGELENAMQSLKFDIADHVWHHPDGGIFNNHYKLLARAFARDGKAGVDKVVHEAAERHALDKAQCRSIPEALALCDRLMGEHKVEQARDIYIQILRQDETNVEALCKLGIAYTHQGFIMEGLETVKKAVAADPLIPTCHRILGDLLRGVGRLQEAEAAVRTALELAPNDPTTLSALGLVLAQQGRAAEGFQAYRAAAALANPSPRIHTSMGLVLAQQNYFSQARECFEAALAIDPGFLPARRGLQGLPRV